MNQIASFDVFDTCITRRVLIPIDVFRLMGREIADLAEVTVTPSWLEQFTWARVRGESLARSKSLSEDVSLDEIWEQVVALMRLPERDYATVEMRWESKMLIPVPGALELIKQQRAAGNQIIFLSDMYLPEHFIKEALETHGFFQTGDRLFVSSATGTTKGSGNLFKHVAKTLAVPTSCFIHHGDNLNSDIKAAKQAGWRTRHLPPDDATISERAIRTCNCLPAEIAISLAGTMRAARLDAVTDEERFCSQFLTPFTFIFVDWVLNSAIRDGIERLYFLGRDCELASKVARHPVFSKFEIDSRYLPSSRNVFLSSSIKDLTPDGIAVIRRRGERIDVKSLLAKLALDESLFRNCWRNANPNRKVPQQLTSSEDWNCLYRALECLKSHHDYPMFAKQRRELLVDYLKQEKVHDSTAKAFVDLGWAGNIQFAAHSLLREASNSSSFSGISGYYLGTVFEVALGIIQRSLFPTFMMADAFPATLYYYINCLEHVAGLSTHGTLVGFKRIDKQIVPSCAPVDQHNGLPNRIQNLHQATLKQLTHFEKFTAHFADEAVARPAIAALVQGLFSSPTQDLAKLIASIPITDVGLSSDSTPLAEPYGWQCIGRAILNRVTKGTVAGVKPRIWIEGSDSLTPRLIRAAIRRLR